MSRSWNKNYQWSQQDRWSDRQWDYAEPRTWESHAPHQVPHPEVPLPTSWNPTSTHFDDNVVYGHRFHRVIQPTAWSRKRGLAGTNPLTVPIGLLTRHGASEFALRALSEGRFLGVVTTRSIPESVFLSQLVKALRDSGIDIDATAESLHRRRDPNAVIPSKVDSPAEFMQPLIQDLVEHLRTFAPVKQDLSTMRQLEAANVELQAAKAKLRQAGLTLTPDRSRPVPARLPTTTEGSASPSAASGVPTGSPGDDVPDGPAKRRRTQPPPGKQQSLPSMFALPGNAEESSTPAPALTPDQALEPKAAVLRPHPLVGTSVPSIKKWMESFPVETQQLSKKVLEMLQEQRYAKEVLQSAAAQYGIPVGDALKLTPKSLLQVISVGAAISA